MRYTLILLLTLLLAACESTGNTVDDGGDDGGIDPNAEQDALEVQAYESTGDVRVFYYVKDMLLASALREGESVRQEEMRHTLLNKSHSFYDRVPDHQMQLEERFLHNTDMYDLLSIFKTAGFFDKGHSLNIFADDPIERADNEVNTTRVIAVEIIKDGKVNTSYFARHVGENLMTDSKSDDEIRRAEVFNQCQAVLMQAVSNALPRGVSGYGTGDTSGLGNERR